MKSTTKITLIYLVLGILWIVISDHLLYYFFKDSELYEQSLFQLLKGIFYVSITAVLLFFLVRNYQKKLEDKIEKLESLNAKLRKEQGRLTDTNMELKHFADSVSHDLKSPLRTISTLIQRYNERFSEDMSPDQKEYISIIRESSENLYEKIEDTLFYAKLSSAENNLEKVDIGKIVDSVVKNLSAQIEEKKGQVDIKRLPRIVSNKSLLYQIFLNLIDNAVKFTSKDSPPHIEIGYIRREDEFHEFYVSDNGPGFPENEYAQAFERYYRGTNSLNSEGSGIGLATVKQILQKLNGKIWIETGVKEGTIIRFILPKV